MGNNFQYDVFLSYSTKDKPVICELAERLKADGLRVWFDAGFMKPYLIKNMEGDRHGA